MILPTTATTWTLFLIFGTVITDTKIKEDELLIDNSNSTSSESWNSLIEESPEKNPWVKIPDDWKSSYPEKRTTDSSENYFPSYAQARYSSSHREPGVRSDGEPEPYFDHAMMTNLSEHLNSQAFLRCRVKNLGDKTVSWIRRRDWHILTSGRNVYTNDDRFQIVHNDGSDEWTLSIRYVQTRDSGTYECQVSSGRGIIAHFFNLHVLVPQAYILGAKEYHVQKGTVISLVCIIENISRSVPQNLNWYHNNQMISPGSISGLLGISVHTEPDIHTHSRLTVPSPGPQHAGNYTCKGTNTEPSTVQVFVSDGDKTAAIQRQSGSHFVPPCWTILAALILLRLQRLQQPLFFR